MQPRRMHVGAGRHPVVIVDAFSGDPEGLVDLAAELAPFPAARNHYPGLRRVIGPEDHEAHARGEALLEAAAPFVAGGFGVDAFRCLEASFSMVTAAPASLTPVQRAPHFDTTDPGHLALLLYLGDAPGSGTAFFRHRATGIEAVTGTNLKGFVAAAERATAADGYIAGSTDAWEEIGRVEAVRDRLAIYPGRLLHSGLIPPGMNFSDDPRRGRLTLNIFIQAAT